MGKRKYILLGLLLVVAAFAACLGIQFYPIWKSARILQENMDLVHFTYELEAELDREALPEEQKDLLEMLARLTGYGEGTFYRFTVRGNVWEDRIHALVFPEDAAEPLMELYLSDGEDVINETMLYNRIRGHLVGEYTLLGYLMPEQESNLYMTLEQVEQIFDVDLSELRSLQLSFGGGMFSDRQYFTMLNAMSREREGEEYSYSLETGRMRLQIDLPAAESGGSVTIGVSAQKPADVLNTLSVVLKTGQGREIKMPDNFVKQDTVDLISKIRAWIKKFFTSALLIRHSACIAIKYPAAS